MQSGWVPPTEVTRDEYNAATNVADPLHTFTSAEPGAFWRRAAQVAARGAPVYMSEAAGPPDDVQATLVHRHPLGRRRMHRGPGERVELLWRLDFP